MKNLDELFEEMKEIESTIQKSVGEKSALTSQMAQYEADINSYEKECLEKFDCSLEDLDDMQTELESEIQSLFNNLKEKVKNLG